MSLMDLLLNSPSLADRVQQILPLISGDSPTSSPMYPSGPSTPGPSGGLGTLVPGGGDTDYRYRTYPTPFTGDPNVVTRQGVTLQRGAMHSLRDVADTLGIPFGQVLNRVGAGSFRTYEDQQRIAAEKPDLAADPGYSYHQQGLAVDWEGLTARLRAALEGAGWNWFDPQTEPWHASYGVVG